GRGVRRDGDRARGGRAGGRRRQGDGGGGGVDRRTVGDGYRDRGRGRAVAGGVAADRSQAVGTVGGSGGVPVDRVRSGGVLGADGGAVELELDPDHARVVGGGGGDRDGAVHRRAGAGRR